MNTIWKMQSSAFLGVGMFVTTFSAFSGQAPISAAEPQEVIAQSYYNTFSRMHPILKRIRPGDTVATETLDASGRDKNGDVRGTQGNPLTGPFYVEGAEAGDILLVKFTKVRLNRNWGYSNFRLGLFSLMPYSIQGLYPNGYKDGVVIPNRRNLVPWDINISRGTVALREPASGIVKLEFPVKPMVGCVGVAPEADFAPLSSQSGYYGGNIDYNEIGEGTTVMLPISHPGALLFLGDGHALQADGEPTGTGIETSMSIEFSVDLRKKTNLAGPRADTSEYIISIGSQTEFESSLDRALQLATSDMINWLVTDYKLEPWAAHLLVGYQGKYHVVTVAGSMALKVPKKYLPSPR